MKTVILCGGLGTRLSEETTLKPKPMVTIGGRPILWHIMKTYGRQGYSEFLLALGYKAEVIKEYFLNYHTLNSDFTINLQTGEVENLRPVSLDWNISLIDTGASSMTGGRLLRLKSALQDEQTFMLTYGDGVADVDINQLIAFHKSHGKVATMTAVRPPARFGTMNFSGEQITHFEEKPQAGEGWINGGYFVFEKEIFSYLDDDTTILERSPLEKLAKDGQLMAYKHEGFWKCMDTLRDKNYLDELCQKGLTPWLNSTLTCKQATKESAFL
jgi:glucose-1-phosphate cytidylyltransferase